jgi:hypothetical protein
MASVTQIYTTGDSLAEPSPSAIPQASRPLPTPLSPGAPPTSPTFLPTSLQRAGIISLLADQAGQPHYICPFLSCSVVQCCAVCSACSQVTTGAHGLPNFVPRAAESFCSISQHPYHNPARHIQSHESPTGVPLLLASPKCSGQLKSRYVAFISRK